MVTPLKLDAKLDWPTAKAFAEAVCEAMAADSPKRYVANMAKKLRTGCIFLDYLHNDRLFTAVAPLSPRVRPGACVSMPVSRGQVKAGLHSKRYTIRSAPALVGKLTSWEDYCDGERSLGPAIRKLC